LSIFVYILETGTRFLYSQFLTKTSSACSSLELQNTDEQGDSWFVEETVVINNINVQAQRLMHRFLYGSCYVGYVLFYVAKLVMVPLHLTLSALSAALYL